MKQKPSFRCGNRRKWISDLESENHELRNDVTFLENENKRLRSVIDNTSTLPKPTQSYDSYDCSGSAKCVSEKIIGIIDGDTIYTTNYKVRLSLSDAPEKNESGFSEATAFTARMCPVGSIAIIDQDDLQFYDKYGRMLANVYCDGKLLNSELLYNGHATILTQYCNDSEFSTESWAQEFGCGSRSCLQILVTLSNLPNPQNYLTSVTLHIQISVFLHHRLIWTVKMFLRRDLLFCSLTLTDLMGTKMESDVNHD